MVIKAGDYRIYRARDGFWMVYSDYAYGYLVPGHLKLVTKDKDEVRRFIRRFVKR